jgi:hypothetical protein
MDLSCSTHGILAKFITILIEHQQGRSYLEDNFVCHRIILLWILQKQDIEI